jgi:hypothetical protein
LRRDYKRNYDWISPHSGLRYRAPASKVIMTVYNPECLTLIVLE